MKEKNDQWKTDQSPEINPQKYGPLIFNKAAKVNQQTLLKQLDSHIKKKEERTLIYTSHQLQKLMQNRS